MAVEPAGRRLFEAMGRAFDLREVARASANGGTLQLYRIEPRG